MGKKGKLYITLVWQTVIRKIIRNKLQRENETTRQLKTTQFLSHEDKQINSWPQGNSRKLTETTGGSPGELREFNGPIIDCLNNRNVRYRDRVSGSSFREIGELVVAEHGGADTKLQNAQRRARWYRLC